MGPYHQHYCGARLGERDKLAREHKKKANGTGNGRKLATQQSVDQAVKSICDIMRRGNCAGAMQYVPELTWILFLRILDEKESREAQEAEALGVPFRSSLEVPFRWRDWATPPEKLPSGQINKRVTLQNAPQNAFFNFVNLELLPHLKDLKNRPTATPRQKVISEIMTGVERVRIDTERNFPDVLDKVDQLTTEYINRTRNVWRTVRRCATNFRRDPDQSALRRKRRKGGPDKLRL